MLCLVFRAKETIPGDVVVEDSEVDVQALAMRVAEHNASGSETVSVFIANGSDVTRPPTFEGHVAALQLSGLASFSGAVRLLS